MPSLNPDPSHQEALPVGPTIVVAAFVAAVLYFVILFLAALVGLVRQLAAPSAEYEPSATLFLAVYPVFLAVSYAFLPELTDRRRLLVASWIAVVPTLLLPLICGFLVPVLASDEPLPSAATLFLVFSGVGILPCFTIARGFVCVDRDAQVAAAGDHVIDTDRLDADTRALIAKHAPSFTAPRGWRAHTLFGTQVLTYRDLQRVLSLEAEEAQRLRDIHVAKAAAAATARDDAYHDLMLSLTPEERALFEATLRADAEAVRGIAAIKAELAQEIARLTEENTGLRAAVTDRGALMQALAHSERTREAKQHELDWLWSEWERHAAAHPKRRSTATPPTVVHLHPRRSSWSAAAPTPYGGRA